MPFIQLMKAQEKDLVGSLQTLLVDDLYAALPELNPSQNSLRPRGRLRNHIDQSEKDYKQPPLALFEIESVPVPIRDKNKLADSFSQVVIEKPYLAAGKDYYIQLRMTELAMCKDI